MQNKDILLGVDGLGQNLNLYPYVESERTVLDDTKCKSHLPSIMELTTPKIKIFEKYYPEYPFPSHETKDQSVDFQLAQTRYWKPILVKHGGPFADCLSRPETHLQMTYPRLINLFYQEKEEERSHNTHLWDHWSQMIRMYHCPSTYRPGYKIRREYGVDGWSQFIMLRKTAIDQRMQREDLQFVVHTV
jgi:hypothetical protein